MLDPVEAHGPARFMLDRLLQDNPKMDITRPIPMSTLTDAFRRMRSGGPVSYGNDGRHGGDEDFFLEQEKTSLVPTFSSKREIIPIAGFGMGAFSSVRIRERGIKEASNLVNRYDRNNDQMLDEDELSLGRWSDPPLQYDQNQDGKLSLPELADRQARQRTARNEQNRPNRDQASAEKKITSALEKKDTPGLFDNRSSYRIEDKDGNPLRPHGIPDWFLQYDVNVDNQVSMREFIKNIDQAAINDFYRFDKNRDGFITSQECLLAIRSGMIPGAASGSTGLTSNSISGSGSTPGQNSGLHANSKSSLRPMDDRMRLWTESKFRKLDKDKNLSLSTDEFMEGDFATADTSKNGVIDFQEYAALRGNR